MGLTLKKLYIPFLVICALMMLFPLLLTVTNSFMSDAELNESYKVSDEVLTKEEGHNKGFFSLKLIPESFTLRQYYEVLIAKQKFLRMFWNSAFVVLPIVAGQVLVSSMAAYAFAKLRFKGRNALFFLYILLMLMPFQVTLVPNYLVLDKLGLIGNNLSLILPGVFSAFGVFLLRQFMLGIPNECIEAARVDGCSQMQIFFRIIMPLSKGGIASLAILSFIDNWNMVEQPLIFLKDANQYPLSVYLSSIKTSELGIAFAAGIIYMLPMLLMFLYGENDLVEGISHSAIKK